jgi:hypothetical protein
MGNSLALNLTESQTFVEKKINEERIGDERSKAKNVVWENQNESVGWKLNKRGEERREEKIEEVCIADGEKGKNKEKYEECKSDKVIVEDGSEGTPSPITTMQMTSIN